MTFLSIPSFCEALSISIATFYRNRDKIRFVRLAGRVLVPSSEVERLASLACAGGADAPVVEAGK